MRIHGARWTAEMTVTMEESMETMETSTHESAERPVHPGTLRQQREWERQRQTARQILERTELPKLAQVRLNTLRIDERYQRSRNEHKVNALRARFHPNACQPLAVSERQDGTRWLVDGQHRAAVLEDLGVKTWFAVLYQGLKPEHEAAMWEAINTGQSKPNPQAKFKASLLQKDPEALAIQATCEARGYAIQLRRQSKKPSGTEIQAIDGLLKIYRRMRKEGLHDVLTFISTAWPDPYETQRTQRIILMGIAEFLAAPWRPRVDFGHAAGVMGRLSPAKWIAKTRGFDELPTVLFCKVMRTEYNRGLPKKQRI